jgi:hypothetical protein
MLVTPGYQFDTGEDITEAKLNMAATPQVDLEDDDLAQIAGSVATGQRNLFRNPDLSQWTRGAGPVSCAADERTYLADHWFCRVKYNSTIPGSPSGTAETATYQRETDDVHEDQLYRARIGKSTGEADEFGDLEFGQRLPARVMVALASGLAVTFELENETGGTMTPKLRVYTCDALDDWTAVTAQATVTGTAVGGGSTLANGQRKVFTFVVDPAAYVDALKRGGELCLVVPEAASFTGYTRIYPICQVEAGTTATARVAERDATAEDDAVSAGTSTTIPVAEYLVNGEFAPHRFPSNGAAVSCGVGETGVADGWTIVNTAGTVTSQRDTANQAPSGLSGDCLKITGDATATSAIQLRQRIYRATAVTAGRNLVFQAQIRNATGGSLTPVLKIKTCGSADDFGTLTERVSQSLTAIADGDWVKESHTFDAGALTDWENGAVLELHFAANTLDNSAKNARIAEVSLRPGLAVSTWEAAPVLDMAAGRVGVENLVIEYVTGTTLTVTGDSAVLRGPDRTTRQYGAFSISIDVGSTGVNKLDTGSFTAGTKYYLHLIGSDDLKAIVSTSATAPAGVAGYAYRYLASVLITLAGSANFREFSQRGRSVHIVNDNGPSHTSASADWTGIGIATFVPTEAVRVGGTIGTTSSGVNLRVAVAMDVDNAAAGPAKGMQQLCAASVASLTTPPGMLGFYAAAAFDVGLKGTAVIYVTSPNANTANYAIVPSRYDLP